MHERLVLAALLAASVAALGLAFFVQYGLGYPPCNLCLQARLPHAAFVLAGGLAFATGLPRIGLGLAVPAFLVAFAISLRHVGVEDGWLPLPGGCQAQTGGGASLDELRSALMTQTRPSCDQPGPTLIGETMATWHAFAALALAIIAAVSLGVARRRS